MSNAKAFMPQDLPGSARETRVNSPAQSFARLEFPVGGTSDNGQWLELLGMIREIVAENGLKQVAYDLDVSPSLLSNALAQRDRHHVLAQWLPYFIRKAKTDDLIAYLAGLRGLDLALRKELSPEEKLERLKDSLRRNLSPAMQEAIWRDAK